MDIAARPARRSKTSYGVPPFLLQVEIAQMRSQPENCLKLSHSKSEHPPRSPNRLILSSMASGAEENSPESSPKRPSSPMTGRGAAIGLQRRKPLAPSAHDVACMHLRRVVPASRQRFDSADHVMKIEADKLERARTVLSEVLNDDTSGRQRRSALAPSSRGDVM
jgi:hypothetical protein